MTPLPDERENWPQPEILKIVGKHSTHWDYDKIKTLTLLDKWLQDYVTSAQADLLREIEGQLPEKQYDLGQAVYNHDGNGTAPRRQIAWMKKEEKLQDIQGTGSDYMDGHNKAIDQVTAVIEKLRKEIEG